MFDDKGGVFVLCLWWMLCWVGYVVVVVFDGGLLVWIVVGYLFVFG